MSTDIEYDARIRTICRRLGIETDIDRGKLGGDVVRCKLRKMGDVNAKLLTALVREADASLRGEGDDA